MLDNPPLARKGQEHGKLSVMADTHWEMVILGDVEILALASANLVLFFCRLLAQMKFRPWNGVFLSDEYLSSVESATQITKELLACYRKHEVVPLLETAVRTKKDLETAHSLLEL